MHLIKGQRGFSFIEVIVAVSVLTTLLSIATINLLGATNRINQSTTESTLISDLKLAQIKAMSGDTEGSEVTSAYGVYFETNKYTLFRGTSYSLSNPTNFIVQLSQNTKFSNILFPSSQLVFASGSGEIIGFLGGSNSITISNTSDNIQKNVTLNRFGVVTSN